MTELSLEAWGERGERLGWSRTENRASSGTRVQVRLIRLVVDGRQ